MKAVVMESTGAPDVLQLSEIDAPQIEQKREIKVRLKAAGVNPIDTKLRRAGTYHPELTPTILGCDGAGIVESVGAAVERFAVGDEVYFCNGGIGGPCGNYAEYAVVDERYVAHKPAALTFVEAAAAPLVLITAWEALHDRVGIKAGDKVLIHAGAGGVGHVAIQLAKIAGAEVLTTVSDQEKAAFCSELGADQVTLYSETDFAKVALSWSRGRGVDCIFDTVGGQTFSDSFAALRYGGDLVTLLQPAPDLDWKIARMRNLRISLELMLTPLYYNMIEARQHQGNILSQCAALFDQGKLGIKVADVLPLARAAEAHQRIEQGSTSGKLVLAIDSE
ncbi:alcohol dehydrogenase [Solemya pervernicosa gill symbiont]|uniref:Alcohol dehydrogenase n=2 Tax=Gammaproteobacteria incertae sedis TaxID=118884 RepID=A0A1T2LAK9_9GAMM|nr:zinc-dependent alcohol dehydrogenase family protein [Candidatus Reidiella endopervernicosa]OOZ42042.1 alcohol dehydrogenase [Solemya pervernicosa gill symbiont]QKQ27012.1 zinc-dependent alcohol dehydrogenase family protein [Candidatus Reidiella endopervernicosa]